MRAQPDARRLHRNFESEGSRSRTDYLRTLENWSTFYPEERIFVGFLEDIHFYPEELLGSVYGFLGVDTSFGRRGSARGSTPGRRAVCWRNQRSTWHGSTGKSSRA